jgi:glycosyltransferase involved in cell wall biosynthesis
MVLGQLNGNLMAENPSLTNRCDSPNWHTPIAGPLRILMLCHEYPPIGGGAAAVCAALADEYRSAGSEVTVVTMHYGDLPAEQSVRGVTVFRVPCGRRRKEMASAWEGLKWSQWAWPLIERLHRRRPFDVTHAHFIMPSGIVADRLQRRAGVPFIITPHGSDVPGYNRERLKLAHAVTRPWWQRIVRRADRIVSPSSSLLGMIYSHARDIRADVIPNGFHSGRFRPLEKERRILLCSRLVERKGFHVFLQAIAELPLGGWSIDIVGDGPMRAKLEALAGRCRVPVRLHGWLDNDSPQLAELYGRAMIFALPSEWENFSIALLEAMSAGCAVVTTNISGNPEVIGEIGCLVPPRDRAALREAIERLTADLSACQRLGDAAARRAAEHFAWNVIADRYLAALRGLVKRETHNVPARRAA